MQNEKLRVVAPRAPAWAGNRGERAISPQLSGLAVRCNNRMKGRRYGSGLCCRIVNICSAPRHASDWQPCACAGAFSKFYVLELPWQAAMKADFHEKTTAGWLIRQRITTLRDRKWRWLFRRSALVNDLNSTYPAPPNRARVLPPALVPRVSNIAVSLPGKHGRLRGRNGGAPADSTEYLRA
ncbi:MAG: hypothetical protein QOH39_3202 [Verrucomicrobiota bacterium]